MQLDFPFKANNYLDLVGPLLMFIKTYHSDVLDSTPEIN